MQNSIKRIIILLLVTLIPLAGAPLGADAATAPLTNGDCSLLTSTIAPGSTSESVVVLQKILNASPDTRVALSGDGSPGNETNFYGALTKIAVKKFQEKYASAVLIPAGLSMGTGYVGNYTLSKLRQVCGELTRVATLPTASTQTLNAVPKLPTSTPGTQSSAPLVSNTVTSTYDGVCGTKVNTCTLGKYRSRMDSSIQYRWACMGTKTNQSTSCQLPKKSSSGGSSGGGSSTPVVPSPSPTPTPTPPPNPKPATSTPTSTPVAPSPKPATTTPTTTKPVVTTCTSFIYSAWGSCQSNNTQTRTVSSSLPPGCTGGVPVTSQACTYTPPTPVTPTTSALMWGAFPGNSSSQLVSFEAMVGKQVQLRSAFINWNDNFPITGYADLRPNGKTLVLFWEQYGVTLDSIISGQSDVYIKKFAADIKTYGGPVFLAPFHEMNGNWDPWGGAVSPNTPAKVVEAWRHVYTVFGKVPNVKFAWTVNNGSVPNTPENAITKYYPGDAYVDIVGIDGFNSGNPWQTFEQAFKPALTTVAQYNKPIYILSMASQEGPGKSAWITDAVTVQMKKYPLLKGWVWFNQSKTYNWRIDSNPESLAAFKSVIY